MKTIEKITCQFMLLRFVLIVVLAAMWARPVEAVVSFSDPADSVEKKGKPDDEKITYEKHIRPLFATRCASCHNPNKTSGDLDVTNYSALMEGGGSGESITPGDADDSYLYQLVIHEDSPEMPPESDKIPETEIQLLKKWIDGGALENSKSTFKRPKAKIAPIATVSPGVRPKKIPTPCRLTKQTLLNLNRPPVVVASDSSPWAPIWVAGGAKNILVYRSTDLEFLGLIPFPEGQIKSLRFGGSGQVLVASGGRGAANGVVRLIDISTVSDISNHKGELDTVLAADVDPNLKAIAFGGPDRKVKAVDTQDISEKFQLTKHTDWVQAVKYSGDGVLLATGDRNGGLRVWESDTGRDYLDLRGHKGPITSVGWSPDSNLLYSASGDGSVKAWEMENGTNVKSWRAHANGITDLKVNRNGQVLTAGRDLLASLWDAQGKLLKRFKVASLPTSVSFCDETGRVFVSCYDGKTDVFDSKTGKKVGHILPSPKPLEKLIEKEKLALNAISTKLAPLTNNGKNLATKIAAESQLVSKLQTDREKLAAQLNEIKKREVELKNNLAKLDKEILAHGKSLNTLKANLASNAKQSAPLLAQAETKKKQIDNLQQEIEFDKKLKAVQASIEATLKKMESLSDNKVALKAKVNKEEALLKGLGKKVESAKLVETSAGSQLKAWDKKVADNRAVVSTGQQSINSKQGVLTKLTSDITQLSSTRKSLQESVQRNPNQAELVSALKGIDTVLAGKNSESKSIESQIKKTQEQVSAAEKFLQSEKANRVAFEQKAKSATANHAACTAEYSKCKVNVDSLKKKLAEAETAFANEEKRLQSLNVELTNLRKL